MNLEDIFLDKIRHYLPGFKQRPSGIIFKCPYCQKDDYATPAKTYSSTKLKGNFYNKKNATRFKCYSCGTSREFHVFLNNHFPSLFLDYVAERESYGLTGFQTNCPTLKTAQRILNQSSTASPIQSTLNTHPAKSHKPKSPQVKTFPRPTPQQQAGQAAHLVHACKQLRHRGPNHHADLWLSTDTWHSDQEQFKDN